MLRTEAISVSQLNSYIKAIIDVDKNLKNIFVIGEISNLKQSGHVYFSLKDSNSLLKAVIFANNADKLTVKLYDGMRVIVRGNIRCYEAAGQYQIYVNEIYPQGIGTAHLELENLKLRLFQEGLFEESNKRELPIYPKKLGVVTSAGGSVIHDIEKVVSRRYPVCEIVLYPVKVQGETSAREIVEGIKCLNQLADVDVIIVGRGGGSFEDLNSFNSEEVARAVHKSKIPIISAVGHETDFTICDLVADKRASTPSVAAEMAVPDVKDLKTAIGEYSKTMRSVLKSKIEFYSQNLNNMKSRLKKAFSSDKVNDLILDVNQSEKLLKKNFNYYLLKKKIEYEDLNKKLKIYSQKEVLERGYALILCEKGKHIKSISELKNKDKIEVIMQDGNIKLEVLKRGI